jgi:hypothetical protein
MRERLPFFQEDHATSHIVSNCLQFFFGGGGGAVKPLRRESWTSRLPDLKQCDFYLWGMLSDTVYGNNSCTAGSLKENVQNSVFLCVTSGICKEHWVVRCDMCEL